MDVVCLGELLIDMVPAEQGRSLVEVSAFKPKPGGAPANVAVAVARLGASSAFIGKVGDDLFGRYLGDVLRQNGVDTHNLCFDHQARTTLGFFAKPDANTAEWIFYRNPGADMLLSVDDLDRDLLASARALHFGSITLIQEPSRSATQEAIRLARQADALISFDVNYRPSLWNNPHDARFWMLETIPSVNLLKVNEMELELLTGSQNFSSAKDLVEMGPSLVVVTHGPHGSYFQTAQSGEYVAGFKVEAVDPVGCGDAFVGGLLSGLLAGKDWRGQFTSQRLIEIVRFANAIGALVATKEGAIPAMPTRIEVAAFMNQFA